MALHPGLGLAVAESLTGGNLQSLVTSETGASDYFIGGITAYTIDRKVELLGVDRETALACNGVSAEVARQMALGVCGLMKADIGLATTGYAETNPSNGVTAPKAHWALCHVRSGGNPVFLDGFAEFPRLTRTEVQLRVSQSALATLVQHLGSLGTARG